MISNEDVQTRVCKVVTEVLKTNSQTLTPQSRFKEDLGADSLDTVTLLMALEDEFKGAISDEDAASLTTIGAAVDFIATKMPRNN